MLKQVQTIVKKGDYYQYQPAQQMIPTQSKIKRQQTPIVSSTNLPVSEYITNQILSFKDARSQYLFNVNYNKNTKNKTNKLYHYEQKNIDQLKTELYQLLNLNDNGINVYIKDEDRKEIEKLIEEIDMFMENREEQLIDFKVRNEGKMIDNEKVKKIIAENITINLTTKYNLKQIQSKILKLQSLDFPQLQNLEHQLQVMIGQKKPLQTLETLPKQYSKQQINNLYNHLNNLQILNSLTLTIDKIERNQEKHVEMKNWVEKVTGVMKVNHDFLVELKEDEALINKLEENFQKNIQQVNGILKELKK